MIRIPIIVRPLGIEEDEHQIYEIHISQVKRHKGEYRDYVVKLYEEYVKEPLVVTHVKHFHRSRGAVKLLELALKKLKYEEKEG